MSRTVTRGNSCNYPYRYVSEKIWLSQIAERNVLPLAVAVAEQLDFDAVEIIEFRGSEGYSLELVDRPDDDVPCDIIGTYHADAFGGYYA